MNNARKLDHLRSLRSLAASIALRAAALLLLWWALTEGSLRDPVFVLASVTLASWASYLICPRGEWPWRPVKIMRFLPYFLWNSLLGGIDVAFRAFRPAMPMNPDIIEFPLRVSGKPALLMAWTVSLLPGTASVYLERDVLLIHVLDTRLPTQAKLRELEQHLKLLLREPNGAGGNASTR